MSNSAITNQCYRKKVEGKLGNERGGREREEKKPVGRKINNIDSSEDQLGGGTEGESDLGTSGYCMLPMVREASALPWTTRIPLNLCPQIHHWNN